MSAVDDPEILRAVLDSLLTGVYLVDRSQKVLLWNTGAERITGYLRQDLVGHAAPKDFLGATDLRNHDADSERPPIDLALRDGRANTQQVSLLHKGGHRVPARLHTVPLRDANDKIIGAVESFTEYISADDLTQRQSKLAKYGCLDPVSGVLNHSMVQSHLRDALATFAEHLVPFSIVCIRIDDLDKIRARHGQGAVASVFRVVGQSLENSLRPTDFIGLWQENEFLAILIECNLSEVQFVGQRLRHMVLQAKVEWWGDLLHLTLSMGSTSAGPGDTAETMLKRAEKALHDSVAQGGDRLVSGGD